jgi:hypothetical protein
MRFAARCHTWNSWLVLVVGAGAIVLATCLPAWFWWAKKSHSVWERPLFYGLAGTVGFCYICACFLTRPERQPPAPPNQY